MAQLFANGARGALSVGIAVGDTALTIASGGALFPIANTDTGAVGGSLDWYKAVLDDGTNFEIVYIRTHTSASTSFTNVLRGQEGTTARAFAAGTVLGVRVTAEDMRLSVGREMLAAPRTYYVRTAPAAVSFTAASANVTWAAHGLSVNAAVVLSVLPNIGTFTVTLASPGVFTKVGHGYAAGRPVKFSSTGALPTGLTAGTSYYVIAAGLTADAFQVSATVGGSAVNTSGSQSGTHYAETTGAMPTFSTAGLLVAGTVYYVKTVVDTSNVTLSTTAGGTAIGTCTVATGSPVYSASTGSDSNTGLANTADSTFLTIQKAVDVVAGNLDCGIHQVTIQVADGTYTGAVGLKAYSGAAIPLIKGNAATPSNVLINVTGSCFTLSAGTRCGWKVESMKLQCTGQGLYCTGVGNSISHGNMVFGACTVAHMYAHGGIISAAGAGSSYSISGSATYHAISLYDGSVSSTGLTVTLTASITVTTFTACIRKALGNWESSTISLGAFSVTGKRYDVDLNSALYGTLANESFFPGTVAGTKTTGGQYI